MAIIKEAIMRDGKLFGYIGKTATAIGAGIIIAGSTFLPVQSSIHNKMLDDTLHNRTGNLVEIAQMQQGYMLEDAVPISQLMGNISYLNDKVFMSVIGDGNKYLPGNSLTQISESTNLAIEYLDSYIEEANSLAPKVSELVNKGAELDAAVRYDRDDNYRTEVYTTMNCSGDDCTTQVHTRQVYDDSDHYWRLDVPKIGSAAGTISDLFNLDLGLGGAEEGKSLAEVYMRMAEVDPAINTQSKMVKNNNTFIAGRDGALSAVQPLLDAYKDFPESYHRRTGSTSKPSFEPEMIVDAVTSPVQDMNVLLTNIEHAEQLNAFLEEFRISTATTALHESNSELAQYLGDKSIELIVLANLPKGKGHNLQKDINLWAILGGAVSGLATGAIGVRVSYLFMENLEMESYSTSYRNRYV